MAPTRALLRGWGPMWALTGCLSSLRPHLPTPVWVSPWLQSGHQAALAWFSMGCRETPAPSLLPQDAGKYLLCHCALPPLFSLTQCSQGCFSHLFPLAAVFCILLSKIYFHRGPTSAQLRGSDVGTEGLWSQLEQCSSQGSSCSLPTPNTPGSPITTNAQRTYLLTNSLFPYITPVYSIPHSPKARTECTTPTFTRKKNNLSITGDSFSLIQDTTEHIKQDKDLQALMLARLMLRKFHIMLKPGDIIQTIFRLE